MAYTEPTWPAAQSPRVVQPAAAPTATAAPAEQMVGTYWIGADGNVWTADSQGVKNRGKYLSGSATSFESALFSSGSYAKQNDPNPPPPQDGPTNLVASGGGGSSAPTYLDTTEARNATRTSIDALPTVLQNKNERAGLDYTSLIGDYDAEDAINQQLYLRNVGDNEATREVGTHTALTGAAQGGRGLSATLSSLGANNGTGRVLANRAVAKEANMDLGNVKKTFEGNAVSLQDSRDALTRDEDKREKDAKKTYDDTLVANDYDTASTAQGLWKDMATLFQQAGMFGEANNAIKTGSGYTQKLTDTTKPNPANYNRSPLAYSAPQLAKYLAGANDMSVSVAGGGQPINGAIFASNKRKKEDI